MRGLAGLNITGISVKPEVSSEEYGIFPGMGLGLVVDRQMTDQIDIHTAAMFLQKGGRITTSTDRVIFRINYFEIPLFLRYVFETDAPVMPYAMAGPSLGFRSAALYRFDDGYKETATEETGFFDFGAALRGGIEISGVY